jgi:hypothetical protein
MMMNHRDDVTSGLIGSARSRSISLIPLEVSLLSEVQAR